ncbi:MAG: SLC13/DASS family transporter [Saprospiraceae bacterium]|nr:SLC13/DASS family transporter [Saprospiraceae bacterium]
MQKVGLWLGLSGLVILLNIPGLGSLSSEGQSALAVAWLMIIWWITEPIPIYATAFVPVVLFPILGILPASDLAASYGHSYVLMLLGGFMLAKGIEKQHLHKRIAFRVLSWLGTDKRLILLGFMIPTAFLSMWITNMAVVLIILPVAMALIDQEKAQSQSEGQFGTALILAIAYAASVGGTGTLIGTPPNLVFTGLLDQLFPAAPEISFFDWLSIGIPLVMICLPIIWVYLSMFFGISGELVGGNQIIKEQSNELKKMSTGEKRALWIFALTAIGWIFRKDIVMGDLTLPGWSSILGIESYVHDSTVAIAGALAFFLTKDGKGQSLLNWNAAASIPWGVAMFLGGGLALGASFKHTGLANWLASNLSGFEGLPLILMISLLVFLMIFITEVNSNTATAIIFLPILASMAMAAKINPLLLMIPATIASSFAFMLPSGTGTNTVVFASERLTVRDMARTGFWLNIIFSLLLPLILYLIVIPILGIENEAPSWLPK